MTTEEVLTNCEIYVDKDGKIMRNIDFYIDNIVNLLTELEK